MLNYIMKQTTEFLESKPKTERKKIGQFFTSKETASFMANLFNVNINKETLYILDPGTGSGILIAALVERLQKSSKVKKINITCYENNIDILPLLKRNMNYIKKISKIPIDYYIFEENYIITQSYDFNIDNECSKKYDMVIGNPPYMKISKAKPEALAMPKLCYGAPNLYFLFTSMSIYNLVENGELVYIIPRSWTSGAYFAKFREYLLSNTRIAQIHLFISRDKVFDNEQVLQETIIIKLIKTQSIKSNVLITSSSTNKDFNKCLKFVVPYNTVVAGKNNYIYLVTTQQEIDIIEKLNRFECTLKDVGVKMKTGLTVDFRNKNLLRNKVGDHIVPLFYSQHIQDGQVCFPIGKEYEYISDERKGMIQENKNYLFVKRFTSKEEKRRLQCGIYLSCKNSQFKSISTQNKLNFIDTLDNSKMSEDLVYGLFTIFNSSIYDLYYRILNGSTQVNATEVNSIPIPSKEVLINLGYRLKTKTSLSVETCNQLLEDLFI